ncbi:MAG: polysaccharide export protein [Campylobacterales bacterium]|nr:polysaccharide export protein [Campylobacterales bacterium]
MESFLKIPSLINIKRHIKFSDIFNRQNQDYLVQNGDILDIMILEAAPATLFATFDPMGGGANKTFSAQMVQSNGKIYIPFAGEITASGKTLRNIEKSIISRLNRKANNPQVLVTLSKNVSHSVSVIGEVSQSAKIPLTPNREKVLDAIAMTGGVKHQINKISLQLTRGNKSITMPLETVIADPNQNIELYPNDIITALYQPKSFTVLGATGRNEEIEFEAKGITLSQGLGRIGGLKDQNADKRGVFLFRWENENIFDDRKLSRSYNGKTPVVYRFDLSDPKTFFLAQKFIIQDKDILYVSNASSVELQKFLNILTSGIYAIATPVRLLN